MYTTDSIGHYSVVEKENTFYLVEVKDECHATDEYFIELFILDFLSLVIIMAKAASSFRNSSGWFTF